MGEAITKTRRGLFALDQFLATPHESQSEYVETLKRGYQFTNHGHVWLWRLPKDQVDVTFRDMNPGTEHFFRVHIMNVLYTDTIHAAIYPLRKDELHDWINVARARVRELVALWPGERFNYVRI